MADTLTIIRAAVRTMLGVTTQVPETDIDRAVCQAVATLSRFFPREVVAQTVFNEDVTSEAWTAIADTAVTLANKPIRFATETVTQSGSDFTRNTDYEIDYINGTITMLSTGGMSAAAATITYKMDTTMLDISSLLTEPISIDQVDVIRNDLVPTEFEAWAVHGDFLMITGSVISSQTRFVDNDHIRIYYLAHHTEPTLNGSGSYPDFLDEVLLIGAAGYALLMEAMSQEYQAVTDLSSARTSISNIAAIHTAIGTAVTALAVSQSDANIALDKAFAEVALANAEYDKVAAVQTSADTELATANTELDKAAAETVLANTEAGLANTELDKIDAATGGVPDAQTELALIITALASGGDFDVALDKVTTHTGQAITALDLVNAELLLGNIALDNVDSHLNSGTRNADNYLDTGDGLINTVTVGRDAAGENREYAVAKIQLAAGYSAEATGRFQHGTALIGEAQQRIAASTSYINEATDRLRVVENKLALVAGWLSISSTYHRSAQGYDTNASIYIQTSQAYQSTGERFTNNARGYIEEARTYILNGDGYISTATAYIQEAVQRLSSVSRYVEEINTRLAQIRAYLEEATTYQNSAASQRESAELFRGEAQGRVREFVATLEDRVQISTHPRISSVRQHGSDTQRTVLSWDHL